MESNKKKMFLILCSIFAIIIGIGTAYAFFNYTNIGESNSLRLGAMEFNTNYTAVTLQNIFPISSSEIENDIDNVATITITVNGNTKYEEGIEYLVTFKDVQNAVANSVIPISFTIDVSGLGTSDNSYFTNRGSTTKLYKVLADDTIYSGEYVVVGYIPASSTATNGTITLKAFVDENKVIISDVYDPLETDELGIIDVYDDSLIISTDEWDNVLASQLSFRVKVEAKEGIWVTEPENFYNLIAGKSTSAPTYVKSYTTSVINNGNPTFTTQDTVETNNNKQEVYYYTGSDAITNGNVIFAGYCWQIVRTTDNGGIRLIYNGIAENNQCTTDRSSNTYLGVKAVGENISLAYYGNSLYGDSYDYDLTTGKFSLVNPENTTRTWTKANYESFMGKYTCLNTTGTNCDNIWYVGEFVWNNDAWVETTRYSIGEVNNYREMGRSSFNAGYSSPANVGYMYNKIYNAKSGVTEGAIYGKDVEYTNGQYLVIETTSGVASSNTTIDRYHHYSCGTLDANDNPETTCEVVRFYYALNSSQYYYIELTGGETIEDALKNMLNYKQAGDNVDANINVYSSAIKDYLEIWYDKNLKDYEQYLDVGAVYCDDRTVASLGGWNKNGGTYSANWLSFRPTSTSVNLDLACLNETDRFSKENSKARIKNPIGLITSIERRLMGDVYAATNSTYWGLAATTFYSNNAYSFEVDSTGIHYHYHIFQPFGVRAAITLKADIELIKGEGTVTSPYQIGPLVNREN